MYNLYKISLEEVPEDAKFFYFKSGYAYALLFTNKRVKGKRALKEEEIALLRPDEKRWLVKSKLTINAEQIKKNEKDYASMLGDFLSRIEEELKKEVKATNETDGN